MNLLASDTGPDNTGGSDDGLEAYAPGLGASSSSSSAGAREEENGGGSGGGLRVSLMPSEGSTRRPPDMGRRVLILALVLVLETAALGAGYLLLIRQESTLMTDRVELEQEMEVLKGEIAKAETAARDVVAFAAQTGAVAEALDSHVYWTALFEFLESRTRSSVHYLNFIGESGGGMVTVDAVGRSYRDVAEQLVKLREDPLVHEVRTSSASARINEIGEIVGVSFSMVMRLDPAVWKRTDFSSSSAPRPATGASTAPTAPGSTAPVIDPDSRAAGSSTAPVTGRGALDVGAEDDTAGGTTAPGGFPDPSTIDLE